MVEMEQESTAVLVDRLANYFEEHKLDEVMRLMPSSVFRVPLNEPELLDIFTAKPDHFIPLVRKAIVKLIADYNQEHSSDQIADEYSKLKIRLSAQEADKLSQIKPDSINSPVCFHAVITGVNEKKSFISKAHLECPNGHDEGSKNVEVDVKRQIPVEKCPNCDSKLLVDPDSSLHDYLQHGTVQEPPEEAKDGNPNDYDIIFTGDQTSDVSVGSRKEIVGMLRSIFNPKENEHALIIDTISISDLEGNQDLMPTMEELKRYKEDASKNDFLENLAKSVAPEVLANTTLLNVKKSILLALVGGTKTERKRGDINVLLLGDPSVAKSSILKFCNKLVKKSMYTSGRGASAAGITIGIVKRPNGTSIAQAGVLPLCNHGFAFIDELDKMSPLDRSGLHEAMEQQTVSISKAGVSMTLPAQTSVIAAANPVGGKWNDDMPVVDNINLKPTLLSRFDMKILIRDRVSGASDERIARHILDEFQSGVKGIYNDEDMMKILNHVRRIKPTLTEGAGKVLVDFYVQLRKKSVDDEQAIVDTRQFESFVRMATAHAKLHFRDTVEEIDVNVAIELYKFAMGTFGFDVDSGEIHQATFEQTSKENKEELFWKVWKNCSNDDGFVDLNDFVNELTTYEKWWNETSAETYIKKLERAGVIFFNKNGWKKV